MSTRIGGGLHPALRAFPGAVMEISADGVVLESNGVLDHRLERALTGLPLDAALDTASRRKWEQMRNAPVGETPRLWELILDGRDTLHPVCFYLARGDEGGVERSWLVEVPGDPRNGLLHDELTAALSEQATSQRQLSKEKSRLGRALHELERELEENERLSRTLQQQNEEMEAQNEELLAMTQELHAGQEQLMQLNHQLERRSRELQVALSARNRFYAAMSHELRTPINAVMGYNDLLLAGIYGPLGERAETAVEHSQRAARHLRELVNDVLDISKLEAGKLDVVAEEVSIPRVVEDLFATLRPIAEGRGCELRLTAGDCPPMLVTDGRRVRQIILNLLSNAIKFGRGKPVWVRCGRSASGGVEVEVIDNGDGIAPENLSRIFDEFVQLDREENAETRTQDGTGLGLPIARRLARLLGAELEVASTPGVGSTFRLLLPSAAALPPHSGAV